ncbi:MAG: methyltransferase domain-containing protein [Gemmatimonadaceae bacterium]|nr:methyltransferase domain-containing protein [Gemmatimonadaceae bacterium]NUQ93637.1 methyltransferase domain-containing protein [Gemmatimonadaceae bacterium]NUR17932.1 methyltransferase domain-containing protein [Gemmatimonadaceae bacterium]NUS98959.1 methyltransferase domain-containing protein [Gemmatimonadaceae bacterium]
MSVLATYRSGVKAHGVRAIATLTRYYAARVFGLLTGPGRQCPLCQSSVREFRPFVEFQYGVVRNRATCPGCGSLERHRAYAHFYREFIAANFSPPIDILHAAPERSLEPVLRSFARRYDLTDYESPPPGHMQLDICDPKLPPQSYDLIVLNHVLMCVPDDRLAVRSLAALLRPGGAILAGESIFRGKSTTSRAEPGYGGRFNQYGDRDLAERFAPLQATIVDVAADVSPEDRTRFGLADHETLIVIRAADPASASAARA